MSDPQQSSTIPDELRDRANDVLERLFALDEAVANARAFRAILEDLHRRDLSTVRESHVSAIGMVRAGTLRAAVGAIMACLDPSDQRGNRASVGQILDLLQDPALAAVFADHTKAAADAVEALASVRTKFEALRQDKLFQHGRALRNDAVAHILIPDEPTPAVEYDTFYRLHDIAEKLVMGSMWRARADKMPHFEALKHGDEIQGLSAAGRVGLKTLGAELNGLQRASPWLLLTTWLFERSNYLHHQLAGNSKVAQQKMIAIYQLLKVCGEYSAMKLTSRKRFLDRIRRIEALNEDTAYRAISSEASDIDAVRVMTIHGSKGLEFRGVHLPVVASRYMPSTHGGATIDPPPTLIRLVMQKGDREAEEESLFFVAMSRARDVLSMSYAQKYTAKQGAKPSKFLASLAGLVTNATFAGSGKAYVAERELAPVEGKEVYTERELEVYTQCPARYRNEYIDGLRGGRDESAYICFHRCVYKTVGWLEAEREKGNSVSVAGALAHLAEVWKAEGPVNHAFEKFHRKNADAMVRELAETIARETVTYAHSEWSIPVGKKRVSIRPDRVLVGADGSVQIQRIRTGKKTKSEIDKRIYALLRRGAAQPFPGRRVSIEAFYLATGEVMPVPAKNDEKLLAEYADAIAGIERGEFHATPEARRCPNCPSYFICTGA